MDRLPELISELNISIAILTVPHDYAKSIADLAIECGIKGILNFTTIPLNFPPDIFLEEYDMITSIEKVAYFVKEG